MQKDTGNDHADRCFRCGCFLDSIDMVSIVWIDGSERPLCTSCFSLLLKEGRIQLIGDKYHFIEDLQNPKRQSLIDEVSRILGYTVTSEDYSAGRTRHEMVRDARELEMSPWIMPRHEFLSMKAEKLCQKIVQQRKKQALRDALHRPSDHSDDDGKSPDHNDSDLV